MAMGKFFRIYEKLKNCETYSILLEHRNHVETILFESEAAAVLTPVEVETLKPLYSKILEAYGCLGVLQIDSEEKTYLYLVMVTGCVSIGKIYDSEIFRITQTYFIPLQYSLHSNEDHFAEVKKLLNSGTFYFSYSTAVESTIDITLNVQQRFAASSTNNQFFWNRILHLYFSRYNIDSNIWLLKAICGNVEIRTVYVGSKQARAAIISRLSCERAGTRFNVRGTNDDGHVANFVETEQIIYLDNKVSSHIQTRGSVPLFWEQPGIQVGSHKIRISRGFEASTPAFIKHLSFLKKRYGQQVIVNLLSTNTGSKEGEAMLSQLFQLHQAQSEYKEVPHILFDYHQECRGGNPQNLSKLKDQVSTFLNDFSFFLAIGTSMVSFQKGVIRTNCLDCLDRTNCVQTFFALDVLEKQLILMKLSDKKTIVSRFNEVFRQMWINNGNEISKIYAGTGAIQGNSKFLDGARSAARTIQNNLLDSNKQEAIDLLLFGSTLNIDLADRVNIYLSPKISHAPLNLCKEMCSRSAEYLDIKKLKVAVATYNVNGGKHFRSVAYKDVTLADWLLDAPKNAQTIDIKGNDYMPADIYAIGFQEIVDLNATNIVSANSENCKAWADELQKVLSRNEEFILVTFQQLVGVCLYIFIKPCHVNYLKDVAVDSVKTGLGGTAGNKGAVAIRFSLYSSSFCFVCAHFAAGQSQVIERNMDYAEIVKKIIFPMGRTLNSHDYIFWCGDFNYRVDMDKEDIKDLIKKNELEQILNYDQLRNQQLQGNVFPDYLEPTITFPPTYKYDLFSDDYDTSEKQRQPAWTDRILWKRQKLLHYLDPSVNQESGNVIFYGRSELKQSDHRPVIALIDIEIKMVNNDKQKAIFYQVMKDLGPCDSTIIIKKYEVADKHQDTIDDGFMELLIQFLSEFGEIILVRVVEETIRITFKTGASALAVYNQNIKELSGHYLDIMLQSPNWIENIQKEMDMFEDKFTHMIKKFENSEVPEESFCRNKSPPPPRPQLPAKYLESISVPTKKALDLKVLDKSSLNKLLNSSKNDILIHSTHMLDQNVDAPPLPLRGVPKTPFKSLPPDIPPPNLPPPGLPPPSLPPPVPSRSLGGPPIPQKKY